MDRRTYLAVCATGIAGMAGCESTGEQSGTPTVETDTVISTATPTSTPRGESSFQVGEVELPNQTPAGESYTMAIAVQNTGGEDGTWTADLYARSRTGDRVQEWAEPTQIELFVPAGETRTWESDLGPVEQAGYTAEYRLGESGPIHSVEITGNTAPIIQTVNPVSEWEQFGDAVDNEISSATIGEIITIAWRHQYYVQNSTYHIFEQCRIYGPDGNRVTMDQYEDEQVVSQNGWQAYEHSMRFRTGGSTPGEYEAEVLARDETGDGTSEPATTTFQLTE